MAKNVTEMQVSEIFGEMSANDLDELRESGIDILVEMVDSEWENRWVGCAPEGGYA